MIALFIAGEVLLLMFAIWLITSGLATLWRCWRRRPRR